MFELDEGFRALRGASAEMAAELREHALAVDADPYDMKPHLDVAAFRLIREFMQQQDADTAQRRPARKTPVARKSR